MSQENGQRWVERRSGGERRVKRFGDFRWFLKTGRRRQVRRQSDRTNICMLDYYPTKLLYRLIVVLLLSVVDALLTLWLIDNGAVEANPVMAYYLNLGPGVFMAAKYFITAAAVILVITLNYVFIRLFRFRVGQLLNVFTGCFATVVVWELLLIAWIVI